MLSVEECRKYVGSDLSDKEVEQIRDALYDFSGIVLEAYFESQKKAGTTGLLSVSTHDSLKGEKN